MEDKKVYCKNCKFFHVNTIDSDIVECRVKYKTIQSESPLYGQINEYEKIQNYHPENRNKNYNCEYYKRKWWKFWA